MTSATRADPPASRRAPGWLAGTNLRIALAAGLLLLAALPLRDLIPVGFGAGYDGRDYATWVRTISLDELVAAARGEALAEPSRLDAYGARRVLPSLVVGTAFRAAGVEPSIPNVIRAFTTLNVALIVLSVWLCCRAAEGLGLDERSRWLVGIALVVSYANLKMPLYYPVLTDTCALAIGSGLLLCHLERRRGPLLALCVVGTFTWPTLGYFGAILLALPRPTRPDVAPGPHRLPTVIAGAAGLAVAILSARLVTTHEISTTPVEPMRSLRALSGAIAGGFVFLALRRLGDSRALWHALHPARLLRTPGFWLALTVVAGGALLVETIAVDPPRFDTVDFLKDTLYTSATQPGIFLLAHVLYFGPTLLFVLLLWPALCENVKRQGAGLVATFALAAVIAVGSESRKLVNLLPFVVVFLAQTVTPRLGVRRLLALALISFVVSKAWLPMDRALELPFLGTLSWRDLYVSSRGPWIKHGAYALQLTLIAPLLPLFWRWSRRSAEERET